uniref:Uncharacterized protein n=1 Tax=Helianthus annuus TaxID=4232 RepID=A0A251UE81_HELAN
MLLSLFNFNFIRTHEVVRFFFAPCKPSNKYPKIHQNAIFFNTIFPRFPLNQNPQLNQNELRI